MIFTLIVTCRRLSFLRLCPRVLRHSIFNHSPSSLLSFDYFLIKVEALLLHNTCLLVFNPWIKIRRLNVVSIHKTRTTLILTYPTRIRDK